MENSNIVSFVNWLESLNLGVKPSLKINEGFNTAAVVVDIGTPLRPIDMTPELNSNICSKIREFTTALTGKKKVQVSYDQLNGIFWANI